MQADPEQSVLKFAAVQADEKLLSKNLKIGPVSLSRYQLLLCAWMKGTCVECVGRISEESQGWGWCL